MSPTIHPKKKADQLRRQAGRSHDELMDEIMLETCTDVSQIQRTGTKAGLARSTKANAWASSRTSVNSPESESKPTAYRSEN